MAGSAQLSERVPDDWYRSAYPPEMDKLPWAQKTSSEVDRLITMLRPEGHERILDLACGTGRHTLELARRGFSVVGVELLEANVEVAKETAEAQSFKAPPPPPRICPSRPQGSSIP